MTGKELRALAPAFARAAQSIYNSWYVDEDCGECCGEEIGSGGICHYIADAIGEVLTEHSIDWTSVNTSIGENHVWVVAQLDDGVWSIDIPWYVYERGGGYCWTKIPDVTFDASDVTIHRESPDPADFDEYVGEW